VDKRSGGHWRTTRRGRKEEQSKVNESVTGAIKRLSRKGQGIKHGNRPKLFQGKKGIKRGRSETGKSSIFI